jgi:hypothetical protein
MSGAAVTRAGGGAGCNEGGPRASGGPGGGGAGGPNSHNGPQRDATVANSGSGGGGARDPVGPSRGGNGALGVVIVRYPQ